MAEVLTRGTRPYALARSLQLRFVDWAHNSKTATNDFRSGLYSVPHARTQSRSILWTSRRRCIALIRSDFANAASRGVTAANPTRFGQNRHQREVRAVIRIVMSSINRCGIQGSFQDHLDSMSSTSMHFSHIDLVRVHTVGATLGLGRETTRAHRCE